MVETFTISTKAKKEIIDLTPKLDSLLHELQVKNGVIVITVAHTTCNLTTGEIGEGTGDDLLEIVEKIIPHVRFRHEHNPSHAWSHMASSLIGPSLSLIAKNGKLLLGTWQSVLLIELNGPRERKLSIAAVPMTSGIVS